MDENFEDNNAEENFKDNNINENLLSQSYLDGLQKVTGSNRASLLDFRLPSHVLEKRKRDWNALFEKYLSHPCTEEVDIELDGSEQDEPEQNGPEQDEPEQDVPEQDEPEQDEPECTTKNCKRFPMRKPMSMVQYWVNTGNQPYTTNNLEKSQSESGSSLAEECLEAVERMNSPCQIINTSLEKNHETNETSRNMNLRLASSSGSSVDTVAYVLANNNTTKKADTIAIMEGSKIVNKEKIHPSIATNNAEKVNQKQKDVSFLDNMLYNLKSKELNINISKNISKNVKIINNNSKSLQGKSQNQENCSNDSDESIFKSKYDFHILSQNSGVENDIEKLLPSSVIENKTFKRKKLYNNTESPAEFTPVSEDNASQLTLRLPLKKCEHPALETPRISSRPSYLVRYHRLKLRTKRKSRISRSFKMLQSQKNGDKNNLQNLLEDCSQANEEEEKNSDQNLKKTDDSGNDIKIQEHCKRKSNSLNKRLLNNSKKKELNLKQLIISLQRLPHKYDYIEINLNQNDKKINCTRNSSQYKSSKKSDVLETKSDNFKNVIKAVSPNVTSNDESDKIGFKSSIIKPHGFSSQIQKSCSKKSVNYIIAFSSDDEPELSVSNLRQSTQKLSKKTSQMKNSNDVNNCSEKEIVGSKNDDVSNKISIPDSNKINSEKKKRDLKRKSDNTTKLAQSEKNRMTNESCKSLLLENNNKSSSKSFTFSKQMDKKLLFMSSDEETIIVEPKDCSVPDKFLEKSKENLSPGKKNLEQKIYQTSSNVSSLNEKEKSSLNGKKTITLESKSLRKSIAVKNLKYSTNSSSDDDLQLPVKLDFNCKPKLISSAAKDSSTTSSPVTEKNVTNSIGDLSVNSVLLKKNEKKVSHLEERINKIKMKNESTLLNSDNNHMKTLTQKCLEIDSSEEENIIENKSSVKEIVKKKTWQNENKSSIKEHSEISKDKSRNKKDREKSKKEYLSSKKPKRKSEMFMSSDEECIIPLKIKST